MTTGNMKSLEGPYSVTYTHRAGPKNLSISCHRGCSILFTKSYNAHYYLTLLKTQLKKVLHQALSKAQTEEKHKVQY